MGVGAITQFQVATNANLKDLKAWYDPTPCPNVQPDTGEDEQERYQEGTGEEGRVGKG